MSCVKLKEVVHFLKIVVCLLLSRPFGILAVKPALSSMFNNRSDIHVRVMSDNTTAVSYINAMGVGGASH